MLSLIPVRRVPSERLPDLIDGVVARVGDIVASGGTIHPTLIPTLAEAVAVEIEAVGDRPTGPIAGPPSAGADTAPTQLRLEESEGE